MSTHPDWAVTQANAALKVGLSVPEIEQRLVAKGLPPATATAVVTAVLEGHVRVAQDTLGQGERSQTTHRLASVLAVSVCLGLAYVFGSGLSAARTLLWLLLPVACIWWADVFSGSTPPALVRWIAWLVVLAVGGYRVILLTL